MSQNQSSSPTDWPISNYPPPPTVPDLPAVPSGVLPSDKNIRRHSAIIYASIGILSLLALVSLIYLKPVLYLATKSTPSSQNILTLRPQITTCRFFYRGCHNRYDLITTLNLTDPVHQALVEAGELHNLNPQVIVTLIVITTDHLPQTPDQVSAVASDLLSLYQSLPKSNLPPLQIDSTTLPTPNQNPESYTIALYLTQNLPPSQTLTLLTQDTHPSSFPQVFTSLFSTSPLSPQM